MRRFVPFLICLALCLGLSACTAPETPEPPPQPPLTGPEPDPAPEPYKIIIYASTAGNTAALEEKARAAGYSVELRPALGEMTDGDLLLGFDDFFWGRACGGQGPELMAWEPAWLSRCGDRVITDRAYGLSVRPAKNSVLPVLYPFLDPASPACGVKTQGWQALWDVMCGLAPAPEEQFWTAEYVGLLARAGRTEEETGEVLDFLDWLGDNWDPGAGALLPMGAPAGDLSTAPAGETGLDFRAYASLHEGEWSRVVDALWELAENPVAASPDWAATDWSVFTD